MPVLPKKGSWREGSSLPHHPAPIHAQAPHTHQPAARASHQSGSAMRRSVRLSRCPMSHR